MVLGTFPRLSTRLNLSIVDVAAARNDFEFSVCLGILEFSKVETSEMVALGSTLLFVVLIVRMADCRERCRFLTVQKMENRYCIFMRCN